MFPQLKELKSVVTNRNFGMNFTVIPSEMINPYISVISFSNLLGS
jgi:hypothetical protein